MRNLAAEFLTEADGEFNTPIEIWDIGIPGATLYYTTAESNLTYNGVPYIPYAMARSSVSTSTDMQSSSLSIQLANVDRVFSAVVGATEIRSSAVKIQKIFRNIAGTSTAACVFFGYIDSYDIDETAVNISLVDRLDVLPYSFPNRTYSDKCPWRFKSTECGIAATTYTFCYKTYTDCETRSNLANFGGFPVVY